LDAGAGPLTAAAHLIVKIFPSIPGICRTKGIVMSIATYADLKAAVANWLNRSNLTARIPDFIALTETRMMYGAQGAGIACEALRIRAMETSADIAISGQSAPAE